jgi:Ca2+:H+ antiporter
MMRSQDASDATLARDTVFAAVMIILTGMTGLTLLIGGIKFKEQEFGWQGVTTTLTVLVTISVLTLILPNFTSAVEGPYYSTAQLIFVSIISLLLYASFLFVQNFRHRNHFVTEEEMEDNLEKPGKKVTILSAVLLPVCLLAVVMLAESMAHDLEHFIESIGAPDALAGIIIALIILLPEGITAVKAAAQNKMQRSLNLSLGSALASISLTIPVVSFYCAITNIPLALGISNALSVLFMLSLLVIVMSLSKGRSTILQGIVLLLLFAIFLFLSLFP